MWHILGSSVSSEHQLNATAYLSIALDHVYSLMTTVFPSSPCQNDQIISYWFLKYDNEFNVLFFNDFLSVTFFPYSDILKTSYIFATFCN